MGLAGRYKSRILPLKAFRRRSAVNQGESAMYELFLETWEEEGLSIIPKTIAAIILLCFTIWFGLVKSILDWTIWLCFGWMHH